MGFDLSLVGSVNRRRDEDCFTISEEVWRRAGGFYAASCPESGVYEELS